MSFAISFKNQPIRYLVAVSLGLMLAVGMSTTLFAATNGGTTMDEQQKEPVQADIQNATCTGANLQYASEINSNECNFGGEEANEKLNRIISEVINFFSVIVGIVAVLMIIVGGFRYIISGGDSANVSTAKNTILYAIIGLIVVVFAQVIVKFVLSKAVDVAS